jgi:hypothetical protein
VSGEAQTHTAKARLGEAGSPEREGLQIATRRCRARAVVTAIDDKGWCVGSLRDCLLGNLKVMTSRLSATDVRGRKKDL